MDGRRNRKNKAAFSNLSGVAWTRPKSRLIQIYRKINKMQDYRSFTDCFIALCDPRKEYNSMAFV